MPTDNSNDSYKNDTSNTTNKDDSDYSKPDDKVHANT